MKNNAYSALAPHYEKLITSCDYEQWSQYVYNKVVEYAPIKTGCDIACGSGYFTRFMKKSGLAYGERVRYGKNGRIGHVYACR